MATVEEPTPQPAVPKADLAINLPGGKAFTDAEASHILRENIAPVVVLVGAVKSGKTTLIASLHDNFQWGPFAGYLAAGSGTLIGFEERCFDSRHESGSENPETLRTRFEEGLIFYHIKARDEQLNTPIQHLLIADMSGEYYERASDSAVEMRDLTIIRRADHLVHLIDGKKLASEELGQRTRSIAAVFMRRCFEEQMLGPNARVDILVTKWDIVLARLGSDGVQTLLKSLEALFFERCAARVSRLRVMSIAARPHFQSELAPGFGLQALFRSWVDELPLQLAPRTRPVIFATATRRPFDAFGIQGNPDTL